MGRGHLVKRRRLGPKIWLLVNFANVVIYIIRSQNQCWFRKSSVFGCKMTLKGVTGLRSWYATYTA